MAWATLALLLVSCSPSSPEAARIPPPDPRLRGVLVAIDFFGRLSTHELPARRGRPIALPPDVGAFTEAFWGGETLYGVARHRDGAYRIYRLSPDAPAEPVGPALESFGLASQASDALLVSGCDEGGFGGIAVLDLAAPREWREVAEGCIAGLSPDGRSVAYSPDGRSVWRKPLDGPGRPVEVFAAEEADDLNGSERPSIAFSELVWSDQGIAFGVQAGDRNAVVRIDPAGDAHMTPLPDVGEVAFVRVEWQPGGDLLAISSASQRGTVMRVLEPTGELRVVGLHPEFTSDLVWSPGGDVLLAGSRAGWLFIDPGGEWIGRFGPSQAYPTDWAAQP